MLAVAGLVYLLTRLLPSDGKKPELIQKAKDGARRLKDEAVKDFEEHKAKMDARRKELEDIKAIENEEERLKRLADFANRR